MATLEHKNIPDTELHPPARVAASDPGAIGAGRGWIDTSGSPYLLKIRNGTNTGWDTIGATGGGIAIGDAVGSGTSGSVLFVDSSGNLAQANANAYINPSTAELLLTASGATRTPVTLKGTSGQTAALLRFEEHGSSTATAAITASGIIGGSSIIPQQEWFCSLRRIAGAHNLASIGGNGGENSFMLWQPALKSTESHYATITSDQNDFSITPWAGCVLRLTSDASRNITGFTLGGGAVPQGFNVKILNVGANNIVLKHQNTGSAAAYRIITPTGGDLTIAPDGVASLWYDETTGRWRAFPNF